MAEERRAPGDGGDGVEIKVNDRRRFTATGEPLAELESPAVPESEPVPESTGSAPSAPGPDPRDGVIAQQAARIDELTRSLASLVEEMKAARARMEREKGRVLEAERAQLAQVLLEAVDELERALAAAAGAAGPLVDGVSLTLASLQKRVAELGAERVAALGAPFDPRLHDAIDLVPVTDPGQDERVVHEIRPGYRIGDRVLRPARVRVGRLVKA